MKQSSEAGKGDRASWDWLPMRMPGVARLISDKRTAWGAAHVAQCWKRGVMLCQPGWFYAREGALAVGVPDADWEREFQEQLRAAGVGPDRPVLWMRTPEAARSESEAGHGA